MAQETLNIVITADNKQAITNINQTIQSTNTLAESLSRVSKPTGDATQSLVNLSRIAQDAPYGFMGIANNLNPMLESFQRLQKESGSSGNALKAMVAGLTGPAGLGVALGVVSSLIVAFGDEIGNFFSKLSGGSETLIQTNKAFHDSKDAFAKAYVEMTNLGNAFESFHNGTMSKKEVLEQYNTTLGKVYGSTKDVAEAEKLYIADKDKYVQAAMYRAAAQLALKKAAEEAFNQQEAAMNPQAFGSRDLGSFALSKLTGQNIPSAAQVLGSEYAIEKGKKQESIFLNIAKSFNAMVEETNKSAEKSVLFGKDSEKGGKGPSAESEMNKSLRLQLELIKQRAELGKKEGGVLDLFKAPEEIAGAETKRLSGISAFGKSKMDGNLGKALEENARVLAAQYKLEDENNKLRLKAIDDQNQAYLKFADTIANTATNALMGLWDAMQQGVPIGEALGNMFADLAKQIAAAAIKAAIFTAIASALGVPTGVIAGGASTATTGGGGFLGTFGKLLGLAEGGVVNKPTLAMIGEGNQHEAVMPLSKLSSMMSTTFNAGAMSGNGGGGSGQFILKGNDLVLALQRSNYNLNLRRG